MSEGLNGASLWTTGNTYHVFIPDDERGEAPDRGVLRNAQAENFDLNGRSLQEVIVEASRIRQGECFNSWEEFERCIDSWGVINHRAISRYKTGKNERIRNCRFGKLKRKPSRNTKLRVASDRESSPDSDDHRKAGHTSGNSDSDEIENDGYENSGKENAAPCYVLSQQQEEDLQFENAIRHMTSQGRSKRLPLGGLEENVDRTDPSQIPVDQQQSNKEPSKTRPQKNTVHQLLAQNRLDKGLPKRPRSLVKHTSVWLPGRHSLLPLPPGTKVKRKSKTGACGELSRFAPNPNDDPDPLHSNKPCPWSVRAIRRAKSGEFRISKCHLTHTCAQQCHRWRGPTSKAKWLGETLAPVMIRHVKGPVKELTVGFQQDYKRTTSYQQMWRAKDLVRDAYLGGQRKSFHCIPGLIDRLKHLDPGCKAEWSAMDGSDVFYRAFVCPSATRKALTYCQPVVCLDACHTKNRKYPTQLFLATVLDGNMEVLPICYAVAPTENLDNWTWFLQLLDRSLEGVEAVLVPLMSDRCKGLISAVKEVFPGKVHGMCANHLRGNVKKEFGKSAEGFFLATVYANTKEMFHEILYVLEHSITKGKAAAEYIGKLDPHLYARHAFPLPRFGHVTSNPCEATNSGLLPIREYAPFKLLVEMWFYMQAHFNNSRKNAAESTDILTRPALIRHTENLKNFGQFQVFDDCGGTAKVVTTTGTEEYLVTRSPKKSCTCFELQDMCWPCEHIMAWDDVDAQPFAAHFHICWRVSSLRKLYEGIIPSFLCNDIALSNRCWPPEVAVKRGRHRVVRIASGSRVSRAQRTGDDVEEDDQGNLYVTYPIEDDHNLVDAMPTPGTTAARERAGEEQQRRRKTGPNSGKCRCSICGKVGHNKRTCTDRNTPPAGEEAAGATSSGRQATWGSGEQESQPAEGYHFPEESQLEVGVREGDYQPGIPPEDTSEAVLDNLLGMLRSVPDYVNSDPDDESEEEDGRHMRGVEFGTSTVARNLEGIQDWLL